MHPIVERVMTQTKPFKLNQKELDRAEVGYGGIEYTIVRRPQADGTYLVAAINVHTGIALEAEVAETKEDVKRAVREVNRWSDKMGWGGKMSDKSRFRK
jgi:hypothetical protein